MFSEQPIDSNAIDGETVDLCVPYVDVAQVDCAQVAAAHIDVGPPGLPKRDVFKMTALEVRITKPALGEGCVGKGASGGAQIG